VYVLLLLVLLLLLLCCCAVEGDRQYYVSIHAGKLLEPQVRLV
jgi:hypothetical protein